MPVEPQGPAADRRCPAGPSSGPAIAADLPAILAIYRPEVLEGTASFELEPPSLPRSSARRPRMVARPQMPWLVAELDGRVAGYGYATSYRDRPAYRFTVEDSVYVAGWARGRGVGRRVARQGGGRSAGAGGARQMVAVIGDSANRRLGASAPGLRLRRGRHPAWAWASSSGAGWTRC